MTTMDGASASTWQKNSLSLIVQIFFSYILEISWSSWLNFTMNRAPIPLLPGRFLGRIRNIQYWPIMSQGGAGWLRSVSFPNDIEIRPDHWIILPVKWVQMWAACQVNVKHCCVTHYKYIYHSPPPAPRLHNGIKYIIIIYFPNFPLIPFKMVPGQ